MYSCRQQHVFHDSKSNRLYYNSSTISSSSLFCCTVSSMSFPSVLCNTTCLLFATNTGRSLLHWSSLLAYLSTAFCFNSMSRFKSDIDYHILSAPHGYHTKGHELTSLTASFLSPSERSRTSLSCLSNAMAVAFRSSVYVSRAAFSRQWTSKRDAYARSLHLGTSSCFGCCGSARIRSRQPWTWEDNWLTKSFKSMSWSGFITLTGMQEEAEKQKTLWVSPRLVQHDPLWYVSHLHDE